MKGFLVKAVAKQLVKCIAFSSFLIGKNKQINTDHCLLLKVKNLAWKEVVNLG